MKLRTLSILLSALLSQPAFADILVYEDFSGYTVDQTIVGQGPATTGFTGNWTNTGGLLADGIVDFVPRSSGLSHGALAGSGGRLEHYRTSGGADNKEITRDIAFTPEAVGGSNVLYLGMLFRYSGGVDVDASVTYYGDSRDNVFTLNNGNFNVQLAGGNGSNLNLGAVAADTTHLMLLRISDNTTGGGGNDAFYDNVEAWLNPSDLGNLGSADASGVGIISKFLGGNNDLSADGLRVFGDLEAGESFFMDEFFVTTDLAAIPEPGTLALVGIALGGLLLFRRRT